MLTIVFLRSDEKIGQQQQRETRNSASTEEQDIFNNKTAMLLSDYSTSEQSSESEAADMKTGGQVCPILLPEFIKKEEILFC